MGTNWENRTETCDFFVGFFPNEDVFSEYVGESEEFYRKFDDDADSVPAPLKVNPRTQDSIPLSRFIRDQGHDWYDHDLMEVGFNAAAVTVAELVKGYSYSDQYSDELSRRASKTGLDKINAFLFISSGVIQEPRSVTTDNFDFRYVGQISYKV